LLIRHCEVIVLVSGVRDRARHAGDASAQLRAAPRVQPEYR
jgi:hypothetical protein